MNKYLPFLCEVKQHCRLNIIELHFFSPRGEN